MKKSPEEEGWMRVYLINPPPADGVKQVREGRCMQRKGAWTAVWSPISLATIASVLRREGMEVFLSDCIVEDIDFEGIKRICRELKPQLAIINAATPSIRSDLSTASYLKEVDGDIKTAIIGIHGTALPEECLEMERALDYVVRGEPEMTIKGLALSLEAGQEPTEISGLSLRVGQEYLHNPDRAFIEDLDSLPFPAWDLVDRSKYLMPFTRKPFLLVGTSRGCPFPCRFCADSAYYGKRLRLRSPERIVEELTWVKRTFGIEDFLFWAESFTISRDFCFKVSEAIIQSGLKVRWVCNSRVDHVDRELLMTFKKAGCWMIGYGLESGDEEVLRGMKKGTNLEQTRGAVTMAKEAGLQVTTHCILGFPGETRQSIMRTVDFVKGLDIDFAQFYCCVPFPGSQLYSQALTEGWIVTDDWTRFEQNFSVLQTSTLSPEETMQLRQKAFWGFYMRPRVLFSMLRRKGFGLQLLDLLLSFKEFLGWTR